MRVPAWILIGFRSTRTLSPPFARAIGFHVSRVRAGLQNVSNRTFLGLYILICGYVNYMYIIYN